VAPADFTEPENMLGAAPALLHGEIVRRGEGTGMPYWATVSTADEIWTLVASLWTFHCELEQGRGASSRHLTPGQPAAADSAGCAPASPCSCLLAACCWSSPACSPWGSAVRWPG